MTTISQKINQGRREEEKLFLTINKLMDAPLDGTDFCYEIGFDDYDNSIELFMSPECPLDFRPSDALNSYLIEICGFNVMYINLLNDKEIHVSKGSTWLPKRNKNGGMLSRYLKFIERNHAKTN